MMKKIKLGEVLDVKRGTSLSGKYYKTEGDYIRLTLGNFNYPSSGWKENKSKDNLYYDGPITPEYIMSKGDIITPLTEQVRGLLGNTATVPEDNLYIQSGDIGKVIPHSDVLYGRFAYYLISSRIVKKQLDACAQQTKIRHTSPDKIKNCAAFIPDKISEQIKIASILDAINSKIELNNRINDNLAQMLRLLYEQWFYRFEFPNEQNLPYNRANGELEWNDKLKRRIPKGWKVQTMLSNELFSVISSGVDRFSTKKYYATADIIGSSIGEGSDIEYETRESRANMQPVINSVWFAKMKNSIKHLFLNKEMSSFVDNSILSTGFYGLKCNEISFEYIASVVSAPIFEITKDRLSHGATQQGIGDDDMANITLLIPDDTTLRKYHEATNGFFAKISNNILENKRLIAIRNFLLPLLMNGQATIAE